MTQYLFYLLLVLLPLGTRQFFGTVIPGVHEYESLFIYASDIILVIYLLRLAFTAHKPSHAVHEKKFTLLFLPLYIFIGFTLLSTYVAPSYTLALYGFLRLLLLIAFAVSVPIVMRQAGVLRKTMILIGILAVIQAGIGIYQFSTQADAGLQLLGEPALSAHTGPTSTIQAEGGRVLRSYGTFPHPNIFGAFLMIGLVALSYLYLLHDDLLYVWKSSQSVWWNFKKFISSRHFFIRILIAAGLFIILLALATTLSRGAWIGAISAMIALLGMAALRGHAHAALRLFTVLLACVALIVYLLSPVITPRTYVAVGQPAVDYRLAYNRVAADLIGPNFFGVGLGNQVLYSVVSGTYQQLGMVKVWEWEPIHNLYLLMAAEIGATGMLSFLVFLAILIWHAIKRSVQLAEVAVFALLIGILVLGLFDHYLWTIQPGRLMLWLVIGLALSHFRTERAR